MTPAQQASLHEALFVAYPDALLLVDAGGLIVLANPAASQLFGYSIDALKGLPVDALVPDAIRPQHAAYRQGYGQAPRVRAMGTHMDLVAKRSDGSHVMVEIALSPLSEWGLPYVVAAVRGIELYPRVQQALQRARTSEGLAKMGRLAVDWREPQAILMEASKVATESLAADAAMIALLEPNRLAFRVVSVAGVLGGIDVETLRMDNRADTPLGHTLAQGSVQHVLDAGQETRFTIPASWLAHGLVSTLSVPLSDRDQSIGVLAVHSRKRRPFNDDEQQFLQSLADLVTISLRRAQSEEALNHAQRMESVGQLTGGIAHDFNNLLMIMQGNMQALKERSSVVADEGAQRMLAAAERASRRAGELTSKLLAYSRRQVLSPRKVDVPALLHALADMLRRTVDQRIRIRVEAAPAVHCLADLGQLESALLNLAINARDAMQDGGTLVFSCHAAQPLEPSVLNELGISAAQSQGFVTIQVTDTGRGMTEAVRARAFEPFFTTKELGRGTGLGLATVYGFAKQSRGTVHVQSTVGRGTTVTMVLPRFVDDTAPVSGGRAQEDELPRLGLKVLLVEDETEVRAVVRDHLHALGCVVTTCSNAEQALATLARDPDQALLLSDVALGPGMLGTTLARECQRQVPALAVLLMSGYSAELVHGDQGFGQGWVLLRKPFDRSQLAQAIVRTLTARPVD
jgi:PAS domain S-box-containing protein